MSPPLGRKVETQSLQVRLPLALKVKLDGTAAAAKRSLNSELRHRLEASYAAEEDWGGPEMMLLTRLWNARFRLAVLIAARALGREDWKLDDVLTDPAVLRAGFGAADEVISELMAKS